jgi:ethanolamine utilization microcompartment shell protein EutS
MTTDELNKYLDKKLDIGAISFLVDAQVRHEIRMRDAEIAQAKADLVIKTLENAKGAVVLGDLQSEQEKLQRIISDVAERLDDHQDWHYYWCRATMGADEACDCGGDQAYDTTRAYIKKDRG